jgi:hypothetical protein
MKGISKAKNIIVILVIGVLGCTAAFVPSGCGIYKFKDVTIPDSIHTVKVNFIENRARYVNPQLSQRLTEKLRQKIVNQTRLNQTNNEESADWIINATISQYDFSTSAISGQKEAGNRLTVAVHIVIIDQRADNTATQYDVSRNFEFSATQSIQQAETALADEMVRSLTDDIFNRIFSNW